ncbi:DNA polymerase III subunit gamma/tau [Candidatus Contubernalis alkaliaceticus]|uniref:DNA polymerase III subunit gamma/tau n=1 Tax=Candidatus Contubernalis alkaliaceticus TaxID=338645 RepID=UPI001F4BD515|nr:DNA polymerase III subunit gamma/tau [Candidatus Contubernalis alkalaceticus]UNC90655.1 DNA polymerase III subunit gamma/tau [Candidatus Contubernalis alkalaceticus]
MNYLALYRKWRPQTFEDLIGQDHITRTLENAVKSGRVSHAYLFCGPRGTGKTSAAKILSKALNCERGPTAHPCNACNLCLGINRGRVMDVLEIDAASNRGIDEIRELRDKVRYGCSQARYKVYIVDEVHMLTAEAFNALLKTLEEPPENVIFILATTEAYKLPQTILSRCQRFDFRRISVPDLIQGLSRVASGEGISVEEGALHLIARSSEGGMRDALGLLEQVMAYSDNSVTLESAKKILGIVEEEIFIEMAAAVLEKKLVKGLKIAGDLVDSGNDMGKFIRDMSSYFRSLVLLKMQGEGPMQLEIPWVCLDVMREQAQSFNHEALMSVLEFLGEALLSLRGSSQPRFVLETTVFKICQVDYCLNLKNLQQKVEVLEKRILGFDKRLSEGENPQQEKPYKSRGFQSRLNRDPSIDVGVDNSRSRDLLLKEDAVKEVSTERFISQGETDDRNDVQQCSMKENKSSKDFVGTKPLIEEQLSLEEVKVLWKKLLNLFSRKDVKMHSMLIRGKPVSFEKGTLTVAVENFICQEKLNLHDNNKGIRESFRKLTGKDIGFSFVLNNTVGEETDNESEVSSFKKDSSFPDQWETSSISTESSAEISDDMHGGSLIDMAVDMFGGKILEPDKKRGGIFDV